MLLSKYMGLISGVRSVVEGSFKLSKASEFNDPFDCCGRLTEHAPPESLVPDDIKRLKDIDPARYLTDFALWVCRFRDQLSSRQLIDRYYRIMCFRKYSGEDDDIDRLFWSHYADGGNGVRVIFDLVEAECSGELEEVQYLAECPIYDLAAVHAGLEDSTLVDFVHRRIFTKGLQWAEEKEVRLAVPLNGRDWRPLGSDGKIFLPVDHQRIVGVDFGVNVSENDATAWMAICRGTKSLSQVRFRKAVKDGRGYSYVYETL